MPENQPPIATPPLEFDNEPRITGTPAFVSACRAAIRDFEKAQRWQLGTQIVSEVAPWGMIWRADFNVQDQLVEPLVNRIVCWGGESGEVALLIAFGQKLSPLPSK
jgi:hypothetical protein